MNVRRTKCLSAVYDQRTLLVATLSPAWRMSMLIAARKKSLISSESALYATQPGPPSETQRITNVGRWTSAMLYSLVENSRAISCSYRIRSMRAIARSSCDTAVTAFVILRSICGLAYRARLVLFVLEFVDFFGGPETGRRFTCEYFAGIIVYQSQVRRA